MAVLHRSSWVVPVTSPPFQDGGVIVESGRIVEVGEVATLKSHYRQTIDHGQGILMPGLVNAHTHLELSHCSAPSRYAKPGDMVAWITELLHFRETYIGQDVSHVARRCLAEMADSGIDLIVDIGNDPSFSRSVHDAQVLFFHELLGLSKGAAEFMGQTLQSHVSDYTCHAPYSTHLDLLQQVKKHNQALNKIMPIHVAESQAEMDFIQTGQGDFRDFIEQRGVWEDSFNVPECSPVQYLADIGLLDQDTLCVHCVHVDDNDLQILQQAKAQICLCVGSNEYLGVGLPPVVEMLDIGLKPCLGTDSLASNPQVSIWREMNLLHKYYPTLSSEQIVTMATSNGAIALDCPEYGSLAPDKVSMIFVDYDGDMPLDYLSFDGSSKNVTRCM